MRGQGTQPYPGNVVPGIPGTGGTNIVTPVPNDRCCVSSELYVRVSASGITSTCFRSRFIVVYRRAYGRAGSRRPDPNIQRSPRCL
jgi:hypothetical protein